MKTLIRIIAIIVVSIIVSSLIPDMTISDGLVNTLFTVVGIVFSVSMSILIGFNLDEVYNESYLRRIRKELKDIRDRFIFYFILSVFLYLVYSTIKDCITTVSVVKLRYDFLVVLFEAFTIGYYVYNLVSLHELNNNLSDKIKEEKRRS